MVTAQGTRVMFHITKKLYRDRILKDGIKPKTKSKRQGLTVTDMKWSYVFLTDNIMRVITEQMGVKLYNKNREKYCIIIVKVDSCDAFGEEGLEIRPHKYHSAGTYSLSDFEYIVDGTIDTKHIIGTVDAPELDVVNVTIKQMLDHYGV